MRKLFHLLTLVTLVLPLTSQAATISSGDLIKASGPAVYYFGADNKRYVFPTDKTYFSWYANFSAVKTISDSELASYPLGGNVTYRPGIKLIKITTDPRVYAVGTGGTLHWIQTEAVATALYGANWAKNIDDIPDAFFINYKMGSVIASSSDFVPAAETNAASSINVDKKLVTAQQPTPTPPPGESTSLTNSGSITSSNNYPYYGQVVTLLGSAVPTASLNSIKIFFDNNLQRTCNYSPCGADVLVPISNTKASYEIRADIDWIDNRQFSVTSTITPGNGSSGITLRLPRPEVTPNSLREVIANVDSSFTARHIDIYMDGGDVKGCDNVQECRYTALEDSTLGTVHSFYAIARDSSGNQRRTDTKTMTVVQTAHPIVSLLLGKYNLQLGETVDVTVTATDDNAVSWTSVALDGVELKRCLSAICTITAGPWSSARTLYFFGQAQNSAGLNGSTTSTSVTVQ